jgi:hypothetical protein
MGKRFEAEGTRQGKRTGLPAVGKLSQVERSKMNGVRVETQHYLDRLARDHKDFLAEVQAGRLRRKTAAR